MMVDKFIQRVTIRWSNMGWNFVSMDDFPSSKPPFWSGRCSIAMLDCRRVTTKRPTEKKGGIIVMLNQQNGQWNGRWYIYNIWLLVKTLAPSEPQDIAGKWMFIPLELIIIGLDPPPYITSKKMQKVGTTNQQWEDLGPRPLLQFPWLSQLSSAVEVSGQW